MLIHPSCFPAKKTTPFPSAEVANSAKDLVSAFMDYKKLCKEQDKEREEIQAKKEMYIQSISSQTEIIKYYLSQKFHERQQFITGMFHALDQGILTGNDVLIDKAMNNIIETMKSSPLSDVMSIMQKINSGTESIEI